MEKFDIIKQIKNHEKRYTIILVIVFILIMLFSGYCILSIDNKELNKINKTVNYRYSSVSSSFQTITLTDKNKLNDIDGLNSNKLSIHIENTTDDKYDYKIVLKKDKTTTRVCGCEKNIEDYKYIRYSLNGKEVLLPNQGTMPDAVSKFLFSQYGITVNVTYSTPDAIKTSPVFTLSLTNLFSLIPTV